MRRGPRPGSHKALDRLSWDAWVAQVRAEQGDAEADLIERLAVEAPTEPPPVVERPVPVPVEPDDRMGDTEKACRERACEAAYGDGQLHRWDST